jgi:hypothetical protein
MQSQSQELRTTGNYPPTLYKKKSPDYPLSKLWNKLDDTQFQCCHRYKFLYLKKFKNLNAYFVSCKLFSKRIEDINQSPRWRFYDKSIIKKLHFGVLLIAAYVCLFLGRDWKYFSKLTKKIIRNYGIFLYPSINNRSYFQLIAEMF